MRLLAIYLTGTMITVPAVLYMIYRLTKNSRRGKEENKVNSSQIGEEIMLATTVALIAGICWLPLLILAVCVFVEKVVERND